MVDDADYDAVMQFKWYAHKDQTGDRFVARRNIKKPDGKRGYQFLHQFLMPGIDRVDHRDGNSLNDQRENLRPATARQNSQGFRKKRRGVTSEFRGVSWYKKYAKWVAEIEVDGNRVFLGYFKEEVDAALAYDKAARKYFKEFASPNFPI